MELLHTKQDFEQAQVWVYSQEGKQRFVCSYTRSLWRGNKANFSKSLIIPPNKGMHSTSSGSRRDSGGGRCQLSPSEVREMLEATNASPCFPSSPHRAQGAVGRGLPRCTPGSCRAHPESWSAPAPAHYIRMNHSLTSAFHSVRFLILWAVSAGLLNPDVCKMQLQHTESHKERRWWQGPEHVVHFS